MRSIVVSLALLLPFALSGCADKQVVPPANAKKAETSSDSEPAKAQEPKKEEVAAKTDEAKPAEPEVAALVLAKPNDVVLDQEVKLLDGTSKKLSDYRGKTLLVVNVASECGLTPQYAELQELYAKYKDKGFEVLAFPSNDYGGQEPGTPAEIRTFVDTKYSVEFTMFDKVATKGDEKAPLYKTLTEETGDGIKGELTWNFTKFLVDPQGHVIQRFEPPVTPLDPQLIAAIERALPGA